MLYNCTLLVVLLLFYLIIFMSHCEWKWCLIFQWFLQTRSCDWKWRLITFILILQRSCEQKYRSYLNYFNKARIANESDRSHLHCTGTTFEWVLAPWIFHACMDNILVYTSTLLTIHCIYPLTNLTKVCIQLVYGKV